MTSTRTAHPTDPGRADAPAPGADGAGSPVPDPDGAGCSAPGAAAADEGAAPARGVDGAGSPVPDPGGVGGSAPRAAAADEGAGAAPGAGRASGVAAPEVPSPPSGRPPGGRGTAPRPGHAADPGTTAPLVWSVPHGPGTLTIRLLTPGLLRTPGFPAHLLEPVTAPATTALAAEADGRATREEADRRAFLDDRWPVLRATARADGARHPAWRALLRAHRLVTEGRLLDPGAEGALTAVGGPVLTAWAGEWNARRADDAAFRDRAAAAVRAATADAYRATDRAVDDPRVRHAVFVSNPDFLDTALTPTPLARYGTGPDGVPPRRARRTLATAHRYLRRLTTRCETVSFFGPVLFTGFDSGRPEPVLRGAPAEERVLVEASTWLVEALGEDLTARTPPGLRIARRHPLFRPLDDGRGLERVVDGKRFRLDPAALALWCAADGRTALDALAAGLGLDPAARDRAVRALGPTLLLTGHPLPATCLDPTHRLAAHDPAGPAAALAEALAAHARTPWPERTASYATVRAMARDLAGGERKAAGAHYADREALFEDRVSPHSERLTFGGPVVDGIRRALSAVLPLCRLAALAAREDARDTVRRATGGVAVPFVRLARAELPPDTPRLDRLRAVLRDLVAAGTPDADGAVHLTAAAIEEATADLWHDIPAAARAGASLPSPDLMAVGPDLARATWLLSELHDDCSSVYGGLERRAHSDPDGLWNGFLRTVSAHLPPGGMATVVSRRRSAHVSPELPGLSVELSGLSAKDRAETLPIAEVEVAADGSALLARGARRLLYPGDLHSPLHRAVSLPALVPVDVETGDRTPRLVIDGVVYQRARWRVPLPPAAGGEPYDRWLAVQRWRLGHGLPRRVFLRHPEEPKPLYVDFADPLAVAETAALPPATVLVGEMLPAPGELWWSTGDGAQCAEFRLGCVVWPAEEGS